MNRLGRNPFEKRVKDAPKKPLRAIDIIREPEPTPARESGFDLARFLMVDLRAESYLLGLKIYLLSVALFD